MDLKTGQLVEVKLKNRKYWNNGRVAYPPSFVIVGGNDYHIEDCEEIVLKPEYQYSDQCSINTVETSSTGNFTINLYPKDRQTLEELVRMGYASDKTEVIRKALQEALGRVTRNTTKHLP